jgi:hypothetical protein
MNTLRSVSAVAPATTGLASWYTPGLVDGFGDRLLMFDNTDSDPLELLRFHPALSAAPEFEEVLRERVHRLRWLSDAAFPAVRAVERLDAEGTLALVSTHTPGKRLSAILAEPRSRNGLHPAFVTWIVRHTMQPLSILQSEGEDISHGALTADRVILTPGGRLCIAEHVLGSALQRLERPGSLLWAEFGLVAPPGDEPGDVTVPQLDARADVFQVAVLALSMLLARRIGPADLQGRLPLLLDECSEAAAARFRFSGAGDPLRLWLERALKVGDGSYRTASDAYADLRELPSHSDSRTFDATGSEPPHRLAKPLVTLQLTAASNGQEAHMANGIPLDEVQLRGARPSVPVPIIPDVTLTETVEDFPAETEVFPAESKSRVRVARVLEIADSHSTEAREMALPLAPPLTSAPKRRSVATWMAVGFGVMALGEAAVIAMLAQGTTNRLSSVKAAGTVVDSPQARGGGVESSAGVGIDPPNSALASAAILDAATRRSLDGDASSLAALAQAASRQRSGGVKLVTPIEVKVLQGDRVLGSSADGPIVTTAGTHQLDLINTALGYRSQYAVTFKAGEITSLTIAIPNGRLSVNAQPWAEVSVDGRVLGETPLANLSIPIGEHELVFRHPQFGERRQTVVVRADIPTRVSTAFDADAAPR